MIFAGKKAVYVTVLKRSCVKKSTNTSKGYTFGT